MKPKNIMLLGFVNRAVEYIDKHMDEEPDARLAELKNIDLASIKDELADNLDLSLGTMQSTMSTLLKAGNEAFDKFIENHSQRSFYDEISNIFDEDKKKEDLVINNQDKLANLLSFYNLDDDFDIEEEFEEEEKQAEENVKEVTEENKEEIEYKLSPEDHELMQEIAKNASSEEDARPLPLHYDKKTNEDIDSIFNEIIENENNDEVDDSNIEPIKEDDESIEQSFEELPPIDTTLINELLDKIITVKDDEDKFEPKQEDIELPVNDDNNDVLGNSELIQNIIEESLKQTEEPLTKENNDIDSNEIVENTVNQVEEISDTNIQEDTIQNENVNDSLEENEFIDDFNDYLEPVYAHEVIENPLVDIHFDEPVEEEINNEVETEKVDETVETVNTNEEPYVSTLIDDLKKQLEVEEEIKKQKEENNKEIYDRISRMYPYLSKSFVKTVFDLKEDFAREYASGQNVVVLHRIRFMNVDNLRQFAEIALNHDYLINVDEDKLIVDIFKQFDNSDGKILANIYEIANQGCLLNGTYEGYNVIVNEEEVG